MKLLNATGRISDEERNIYFVLATVRSLGTSAIVVSVNKSCPKLDCNMMRK